MIQNYVADTTAIVSFFSSIFGCECAISNRAVNLIRSALEDPSEVRLNIPSIVFVEIYYKWFRDEEQAEQVYYEVFRRVDSCPNIEIKPLEEEVIHEILLLHDDEINLQNHDKIVLASAATLRCPLITSDTMLLKYNRRYGLLPEIVT